MDLEESDEEAAYNQWLEQWLRERCEARAALGPPPAGAVEPAVPPAIMHVADDSVAAGLPPTLASANVPDDAPPEALYWKVVTSGEIAESTSVGEGDNGDVTLRLHCKGSGTGVIAPMTEVVFKRSDAENVTRETFDAWVADVDGATDDEGADLANPANTSVWQTHDTGDVDRGGGSGRVDPNEDLNDSAPAAFAKVLTYQTMMEQKSLGNAELRATTLRVRDYALRATCPRHPFRGRAYRLVHYIFRRLCTRAS